MPESYNKELCEERHGTIEKALTHLFEEKKENGDRFVALEKAFVTLGACIEKKINRVQWILIAALIALVIDVIRGFYVFKAVVK